MTHRPLTSIVEFLNLERKTEPCRAMLHENNYFLKVSPFVSNIPVNLNWLIKLLPWVPLLWLRAEESNVYLEIFGKPIQTPRSISAAPLAKPLYSQIFPSYLLIEENSIFSKLICGKVFSSAVFDWMGWDRLRSMLLQLLLRLYPYTFEKRDALGFTIWGYAPQSCVPNCGAPNCGTPKCAPKSCAPKCCAPATDPTWQLGTVWVQEPRRTQLSLHQDQFFTQPTKHELNKLLWSFANVGRV